MAARAYGSMITVPTIPSPLVQGTVVIVRASVSKGDPEPQVLIVDDDRQGKIARGPAGSSAEDQHYRL